MQDGDESVDRGLGRRLSKSAGFLRGRRQMCLIFMGNNLSIFLEKIQSDSELQARLEALKSLPIEERQAGFLALSAEIGAPISLADLKEFASQDEISEASLEEVAGGGGKFRPNFYPKSSNDDPNAPSSFKEFLSHFGINL